MKTIKINRFKFQQKDIEIIGSHIKKLQTRLEDEMCKTIESDMDPLVFLNKTAEIISEEEAKLTDKEKEVINNYDTCLANNKENPASRFFFTGVGSLIVMFTWTINQTSSIMQFVEANILLVMLILNIRYAMNFMKTMKLAKRINEYASK